MRKKADPQTVLRALVPYPAVFVPNAFGGRDVFFPNWPGAEITAPNMELARNAARESLTDLILETLKAGARPPAPSDPRNLTADEDEPAGTRVFMIEPDQARVTRTLGLAKARLRTAPTGQKYKP
ncbi:MAG: hypothetical protein KKB20_11860 [Proteobacteria bacterium]|nr:hypothetical protein [Pseudomonadota bacterium]